MFFIEVKWKDCTLIVITLIVTSQIKPFGLIHTSSGSCVHQELDGCFGEFTLLTECDACFPEALVVRHLVWCIDKDVIHVAYDPIKVY